MRGTTNQLARKMLSEQGLLDRPAQRSSPWQHAVPADPWQEAGAQAAAAARAQQAALKPAMLQQAVVEPEPAAHSAVPESQASPAVQQALLRTASAPARRSPRISAAWQHQLSDPQQQGLRLSVSPTLPLQAVSPTLPLQPDSVKAALKSLPALQASDEASQSAVPEQPQALCAAQETQADSDAQVSLCMCTVR